MSFDPLTTFFAFTVATLSYVAFLFLSHRSEMKFVREQISPIVKQVQQTIAQNYLANGNVPTKSEIISLLSGFARQEDIKLLSHYPMHQLIDDLIYGVISNAYLDNIRKEQLSQSLMQLKTKPMLSEDYVYLVSELEKEGNTQSRWQIRNYTQALVATSVFVVIAALPILQFGEQMSPAMTAFFDMAIFTTICFSLYLIVGAVMTLTGSWWNANKRKQGTIPSAKSLLNHNKLSLSELKKSPLASIISLGQGQEQGQSIKHQSVSVEELQKQNQDTIQQINDMPEPAEQPQRQPEEQQEVTQ